MTLEDRFYPPNTNPLTIFDNVFVKTMGAIGTAYQTVTAKPCSTLVADMYCASGLMHLATNAYVLAPNHDFNHKVFGIMTLPFAAIPFIVARTYKIESPLEEEIRLQAIEAPHGKFDGKVVRAGILGLSTYVFSKGLGKVIEPSLVKHEGPLSDTGEPAFFLSLGATWMLFTAAYALSKSRTPQPPKKSLAARAAQAVQSYFMKSPEPAIH